MQGITIIKSIVFTGVLLACTGKDVKDVKSTFLEEIDKQDLNSFFRYTSKDGVNRLEYYYGNLSEKNNEERLFNALKTQFSNSNAVQKSDSLIYLLSNKLNGQDNRNTITFIKENNVWLLDDYRQGK